MNAWKARDCDEVAIINLCDITKVFIHSEKWDSIELIIILTLKRILLGINWLHVERKDNNSISLLLEKDIG